jgi:hypothetical protein
MTSMPVHGISKAELFEELQTESKPEIISRLLKAKGSIKDLAADTGSDEDQNYKQVIL